MNQKFDPQQIFYYQIKPNNHSFAVMLVKLCDHLKISYLSSYVALMVLKYNFLMPKVWN